MIFCKNPEADVPILTIYDFIGQTKNEDGSVEGIDGKEFADYLAFIESQGKKGIDIYINSLGGSIVDGMTIYSAIKSSSIPVNTICVGVAVSMAGVILQAGKSRKMVPWGQMMIHNPSGGDTKELDALKSTLLKMLSPRSGISETEMSAIMDETSWLDAGQCLEMKLIDEIADITTDANLPLIDKTTKPEAAYKSLLNVVNELKINTMKGLAAILELPETATESEYIKSVKTIQNSVKQLKELSDKAEKLTTDNKEMEDKLKKAEKERDALKDSLNEKEEECNKLKKEKEDAANAAAASKASEMVENAIKDGKFKAELKQEWVDMAIANFDGTKKLIDGMASVRRGASAHIESSQIPSDAKGKSTNLAPGAKVKSMAEIMADKAKQLGYKK